MTQLASIIIPIASYHTEVADYALASARGQTIPAQIITVLDNERRGAGWARNEGARQAKGLFLVFLDADDTIEPDFIAHTVEAWQPGTYVYVDDYQGGSLHQTPDDKVYVNGTWHAVTTLLPKAYFDFVGGFDETLPAIEDLDLYLKLQHKGVCGIRCPNPLLHYSQHGLRSATFMRRPDMELIKADVKEKYPMAGGCCGGKPTPITTPIEKQDGMVLARCLYSGRPERSIRGGMYPRPRSQTGMRLWIWPEDAAAKPHLWQIIEQPPDPEVIKAMGPDVETVQRLAQEALNDAP